MERISLHWILGRCCLVHRSIALVIWCRWSMWTKPSWESIWGRQKKQTTIFSSPPISYSTHSKLACRSPFPLSSRSSTLINCIVFSAMPPPRNHPLFYRPYLPTLTHIMRILNPSCMSSAVILRHGAILGGWLPSIPLCRPCSAALTSNYSLPSIATLVTSLPG